MSAENDTPEDEATDEGSTGPVGGERLAEARRELKISVLDIAKELHLDEFKVRALESNDFEVIGAPVFAKGHLRKYAKIVKVDERDVMSDYYELTRASGAPLLVPTRPRVRKMISPGPWIAVLLVLLLAAAGYWWFANYEAIEDEPVVGMVAPLPAANDEIDAIAAQPLPEDDTAGADDNTTAASEPPADAAVAGAEPELVVAEPSTDNAGELRLSISFTGDCWTEITDASGRRLFFELGKAGRTVNLTGEAPFNVLFGSADNVSLQVNGSRYQISAADRRGRTARMTITGS